MNTLETLVSKHSGELFGYLYRFTGNRAVAEDVLSDVYVKLMEHLKKATDQDFNWRAWLYRVATNCAISHQRKEKIRQWFRTSKHHNTESELTPQKALESEQEGARLKMAVQALNEKLRTTLILRIYNELSYDEISDVLKINVGTVKSRINEAKARIKELLEEHYG